MDVTSKTSEVPEEPAAAAGTERVWQAGRLEPMPIRPLPPAPPSLHILGPTVFLVALGVGMGESYMWPRLVLVFGPDIRWLFMVGVTLQAFVLLEMARYAMATGESIFFGAARVFKPLMWFFYVAAILIYIWPGHLSAGAAAFEEMSGIPWQVSACVALVFVGVLFSLLSVIYNFLEKLLGFLIGFLVVGTSIIAAIVGSWDDLAQTISGMFAFGFLPGQGVVGRPGSRSWSVRSPSPDRPACSRCGTPCSCATAVPVWVPTSRRSADCGRRTRRSRCRRGATCSTPRTPRR